MNDTENQLVEIVNILTPLEVDTHGWDLDHFDSLHRERCECECECRKGQEMCRCRKPAANQHGHRGGRYLRHRRGYYNDNDSDSDNDNDNDNEEQDAGCTEAYPPEFWDDVCECKCPCQEEIPDELKQQILSRWADREERLTMEILRDIKQLHRGLSKECAMNHGFDLCEDCIRARTDPEIVARARDVSMVETYPRDQLPFLRHKRKGGGGCCDEQYVVFELNEKPYLRDKVRRLERRLEASLEQR